MGGRPTVTDRIVGLRALQRKGVCPVCRKSIPTGVRVLIVETLAPVTVRRGFCGDKVRPVKERALCEACSTDRLVMKIQRLTRIIQDAQETLKMIGIKE